MAKPARRDAAKERFWRRMLGQWRRSGLSGREFCDLQGLSEPSFYAWRREIARRDQAVGTTVESPANTGGKRAEPELPAFVRVALAENTTRASAIEVVVGQGRVLRVRPGFDAELLRQLLRLLEEQPASQAQEEPAC